MTSLAFEKRRVLYLVYGDVFSNVFGSQLKPLWSQAEDLGVSYHVGAILSPRILFDSHMRRKLHCLEVDSSIPWSVSFLGAGFPSRWPWLGTMSIRRWLADFKPDIVHARGPVAGGLAARAIQLLPSSSRPQLVLDVRGNTLAELGAGGWFSSERQIQKARNMIEGLEGEACRCSSHVFCVSTPLLEFIREHYGYDGSASVIPCWSSCQSKVPEVDSRSRENVRLELGFEDEDFVWCYAGSTAPWQSLPEILQGIDRLHREHSRHRLLCLTDTPEDLKRNIQTLGISSTLCVIRSGSREKALGWMKGADAGILLRKVNDINCVASPMKLGDYFLAGLPVLMSDQIGDASRWVREEALGWITSTLEVEDLAAQAKRFQKMIEERGRETFQERVRLFRLRKLSLDRYLDVYRNVYHRRKEHHAE